MTLFQVEVEKTLRWEVYVEAADADEAGMNAAALADSEPPYEWTEGPIDVVHASEHTALPADVEQVWCGGEAGRFVHGDDYDEGVRS